MAWFNNKKLEAPQVPQGVNWEKLLLDIKDGVTECKSEITHTKDGQKEFKEEFTQHCKDENQDKVNLKTSICKKIDDMVCPDHATVLADNVKIIELEKKKLIQNGEIKKAKDDAKTAKTAVEGIISEKKGRKSAFTDIRVILVMVALGITIITKIMDLW